tara:strand:+ start:32338 stop:35295 length:2958 start_codon:yes stop_codon:yes gene_type:complete
MMNRALLQRQMFANGGAAVPNQFKGFSKLPEEVQMKMNPELAKKYEEGGSVYNVDPSRQEAVSDAGVYDPNNVANVARFLRDNPGTTVSEYNGFFGTNLNPEEFEIFEKPKPMQEGGVAGLMTQPDMAAMPMGSTQEAVDPAVLETALQGASEEVGDLEQAGDFKSMMDQFSGENKSEEERRDDLASIVGPEDAAQTPDSVLALVTPVVQISMLDQGIAPMAQEAMDTPVEGDMAGGIMSMTGAGNEPPVNFNQGGEVLRRGDEDPVQFFNVGGAITPMTDYQQQVGKTAKALLPTFQQFIPTTDPDVAKRRLQSDILFDIANTALAFSAPMEGERPGLSAAERLALATQKTQLLPKIQQRTAKSAAEQKAQETAIKSGALQAALGLEQARLKQVGAERGQVISGSFTLADTAKKLAAKKEEGVLGRDHEVKMQQNKFGLQAQLDAVNKKLDFGYDTKLAKQKEEIEGNLKKIQEAIDLNKINVQQEDALEKINLQNAGKKDVVNLNNIASLERLKLNIQSKEGIAAANNQMKKVISDEKNRTNLIINRNNITQQNLRLRFDKVREANLVADRQAKNKQAIAELDLKKVTESRKTLEGLRDFELKKAQGERDDKKLELIEKELNEVKIAETQIKRFSAENRAENDAAVLAYKKDALAKLDASRTRANDLKEELNQITRTNNIVNQQIKKDELALKTHKAQLELFGSGATGKTLNLLSNANRYEAYRDGKTDNQFELAIQNYVAKTTGPGGETIEKELPPYLKEVLVDRLEQGLRIPDIPLFKLGLSQNQIDRLRPVSDEVGEEAINTVIDEGVDLTQGTGVMSTVNTAMRWIAGQISEFGIGKGDVLTDTSSARKMLNALANVTEGFLREAVSNDRLDKDTIAIVRRDILRPTGGMTDANAYAQLKQTQQTIKAKLDEKRVILNNPSQYTTSQITKTRETVTMMKNLINNYGIALRSYEKFGGFGEGGGGSEQLLQNIFKKRKVN